MTTQEPIWIDPNQPRTAPIDWPIRSAREVSDWGIDPGSGARIVRLTSGAFEHRLIYTEQPYTSPDGRRTVIVRYSDSFMPEWQLLVADVVSGEMWLVEPSILRGSAANSSYSEWLYYTTHAARQKYPLGYDAH